MTYEPHLIAANLSYPLLVWFFICLFSGRKYFLSSLALMCLWLIYCYAISNGMFKPFSYIESKGVLIRIDSAFALIMTVIFIFDKLAIRHAILLSFATLCHIMVILSIKNESYGLFFYYYDELIIMVGLLQMVVSYGGFKTALCNIRGLLLWRNCDNNGNCKDISTQKKRGTKT